MSFSIFDLLTPCPVFILIVRMRPAALYQNKLFSQWKGCYQPVRYLHLFVWFQQRHSIDLSRFLPTKHPDPKKVTPIWIGILSYKCWEISKHFYQALISWRRTIKSIFSKLLFSSTMSILWLIRPTCPSHWDDFLKLMQLTGTNVSWLLELNFKPILALGWCVSFKTKCLTPHELCFLAPGINDCYFTLVLGVGLVGILATSANKIGSKKAFHSWEDD